LNVDTASSSFFLVYAIDKDWQAANTKHDEMETKLFFEEEAAKELFGVKNKCQVIMSYIKLKLLGDV
jgi:hypothetical protein